MSEVRNHVERVLKEHAYNGADLGHHGPRVEYCICGWKAEGWNVHDGHIADEVVKALQVTEEEQWVVVARDGSRWVGRSHASAMDAVLQPHPLDVGRAYQPDHVEREVRFVSPWVVVEEQKQ